MFEELEWTEDGLYRAYGLFFCPWCGDCYHEVLIEKFNFKTIPNATWFRLLPKYGEKGYNWTAFPTNDPSLIEADLMCPGCGGIYQDIKENTYWYCAGKNYGNGNIGARVAKGAAKSKNRTLEGEDERKKYAADANNQRDDPGSADPWPELFGFDT